MRPRTLFCVVVLVGLPALAFLTALDNGFHLDDAYRVVDNPGIQQVAPLWRHFSDAATSATLPRLQQYRPLLPLTLSLSYALSGDDPRGFHLGNLALHIGTARTCPQASRDLLRASGSRRSSQRSSTGVET